MRAGGRREPLPRKRRFTTKQAKLRRGSSRSDAAKRHFVDGMHTDKRASKKRDRTALGQATPRRPCLGGWGDAHHGRSKSITRPRQKPNAKPRSGLRGSILSSDVAIVSTDHVNQSSARRPEKTLRCHFRQVAGRSLGGARRISAPRGESRSRPSTTFAASMAIFYPNGPSSKARTSFEPGRQCARFSPRQNSNRRWAGSKTRPDIGRA